MLWDKRLSDKACGAFILDMLKHTTPASHQKGKEKDITLIALLAWLGIAAVIIATLLSGCGQEAWAESFTTEASYYDRASCIREGTSGICASGQRLDNNKLTCASWDYKFGTRLLVTNKLNGRQVVVCVNDRGPSKRLYKRNRRIDLSRAAFKAITSLESGVAPVSIEVVR